MNEEALSMVVNRLEATSNLLKDVARIIGQEQAKEREIPKRPDKAPEGFEFTGEFRPARKGEWAISALRDNDDPWPNHGSTTCFNYWILRKLPTIESVYGKPLGELTPPDGWEFTGEFRNALDAEHYMGDNGLDYTVGQIFPVGPRLILRRKPKPRRWVFEEVGHDRPPRKGEFTLNTYANGARTFAESASDYAGEYETILRLVEKPE